MCLFVLVFALRDEFLFYLLPGWYFRFTVHLGLFISVIFHIGQPVYVLKLNNYGSSSVVGRTSLLLCMFHKQCLNFLTEMFALLLRRHLSILDNASHYISPLLQTVVNRWATTFTECFLPL